MQRSKSLPHISTPKQTKKTEAPSRAKSLTRKRKSSVESSCIVDKPQKVPKMDSTESLKRQFSPTVYYDSGSEFSLISEELAEFLHQRGNTNHQSTRHPHMITLESSLCSICGRFVGQSGLRKHSYMHVYEGSIRGPLGLHMDKFLDLFPSD